MEEIWKNCPSLGTHVFVSNKGNVKSVYDDGTERMRKIRINAGGYCSLTAKRNGRPTTALVHRLVAEAFLPNPCKLLQVNHIDGVKTNNNLENLEWINCLDNMRHSWLMGLHKPPSGEKNSRTKLTNADVLAIKAMIDEDKYKSSYIIKHWGISPSILSRIKKGTGWQSVIGTDK